VTVTATVPRGKTRAPALQVLPDPARLEHIPLELIDIDDNVRDDVGDLTELAASIAALGIQQPIKVTAQPDGRYRLVFGQRRVLASRQTNLTTILAIVEAPSDVDQVGVRRSVEQLAENLQRKDLNAIEEAVALREVLAADPKLTQAELARRLGVSAPWVSNTLGLIEAPAEIQGMIRDGRLSASHAKALKGLAPKTQVAIAKQAVDQGASAHGVEVLVQQHKRDEEWRQQRHAQSRDRTEAATTGLLERLAKRKTPLDTVIRVDSWSDDTSVALILKALTNAGYTGAAKGSTNGFQRDGCGCTALTIQVGYGEPSVREVCLVKAHADAANARREEKWRAEQELATSGRAAAKAYVEAELVVATSSRLWARILLWNSLGWAAKDWAQKHGQEGVKRPDVWAAICGLSDDELRSELATRLTNNLRDQDVKVPWQRILDEVNGVTAATQATPAKTTKTTPAKTTPKISEKALAAARAELGLDGDD
jgi:ParB/RepB/Spo0J family partition protein